MKLSTEFVLVVALCSSLAATAQPAASDPVKAIVASYLEIHARLSADAIDGVKAPAEAIVAKAGALPGGGTELTAVGKAVAATSSLQQARDAFGALSDAVIAVATANGWKEVGDVRIGYCPMVKRSWLQTGETVKNPYYGAAMLSCGELKKP